MSISFDGNRLCISLEGPSLMVQPTDNNRYDLFSILNYFGMRPDFSSDSLAFRLELTAVLHLLGFPQLEYAYNRAFVEDNSVDLLFTYGDRSFILYYYEYRKVNLIAANEYSALVLGVHQLPDGKLDIRGMSYDRITSRVTYIDGHSKIHKLEVFVPPSTNVDKFIGRNEDIGFVLPVNEQVAKGDVLEAIITDLHTGKDTVFEFTVSRIE